MVQMGGGLQFVVYVDAASCTFTSVSGMNHPLNLRRPRFTLYPLLRHALKIFSIEPNVSNNSDMNEQSWRS